MPGWTSDKTTHVCAVDKDGKVAWRGVCATDTQALASALKMHCEGLVRVVLETGTLSSFLYHGLIERGIAVAERFRDSISNAQIFGCASAIHFGIW